jgi:hypothetical protein
MVDWIVAQVTKKPGVSTKWLWENRPRIGKQPPMASKTFDECLEVARTSRDLRTANKLWWPAGHLGTRKDPKPPRKKPDPRQIDFTKGNT